MFLRIQCIHNSLRQNRKKCDAEKQGGLFHFQVTILDNGLSQDSFAFQNEFDLRLFF